MSLQKSAPRHDLKWAASRKVVIAHSLALVLILVHLGPTGAVPLIEQEVRDPRAPGNIQEGLSDYDGFSEGKRMSMMRLKKSFEGEADEDYYDDTINEVEKRLSQMRLKKMSMMRLKKSSGYEQGKRMSMMRLRRGPSMMRLRRGPSMMRLKRLMTQMRLKKDNSDPCFWVDDQCLTEAELELAQLGVLGNV